MTIQNDVDLLVRAGWPRPGSAEPTAPGGRPVVRRIASGTDAPLPAPHPRGSARLAAGIPTQPDRPRGVRRRMMPPLGMMPRRIQRFEVLAELGRGGMGTVYRARDPQLEREIAIKVLAHTPPAALPVAPGDTVDLRQGGPPASDDLLREARMMARLSHPNVLPVYEVGVADGAVFVVMEYIAGSDLEQWLDHPRSTAEILAVFAQAARGLAAAHAHGIVHRDFKPANVLLGSDGRVRVADFGLSRLWGGSTSMIQLDTGHGTPRFMAPELWRGATATPASDVYALCAALIDALGVDERAPDATRTQAWRNRKLTPELRKALARGVAEDPAARIPLDALQAELEPAVRPRRRTLINGAIALAAIAGGVSVAFAVTPRAARSDAACEADPALFAGRWDAVQRVRLIGSLGGSLGGASAAADTAGVLGVADARKQAIQIGVVAGCTAARTGQLVARDVQIRTSCLERRGFELGAVVANLIAHPQPIAVTRNRLESMPEAAECAEVSAPALPADRAPVIALYQRWAAAADRGMATADAPVYRALLAGLEHDAHALGERELEARATGALGYALRFEDKLADADQALERAYRAALDLHANNMTIDLLAQRGDIASLRGDAASAAQLVQLARDAAAKPTTSVKSRVHMHVVVGRAAAERGDFKTGIAELEAGLALLQQTGYLLPGYASELRFNLTHALVDAGRPGDAVKIARDNVAIIERQVGDRDANYGVAVNQLAYALRVADQPAEAIIHRRVALAIMLATQPANSSHVLLERADLAADLQELGEVEAARAEMASLIEQTAHNETFAAQRAGLLDQYSQTLYDTGHFEDALRVVGDALEASIEKNGKDHPVTLSVRSDQLTYEHETGKLELANRHLAALQAGYRSHDDKQSLAQLDGSLGSQMATEAGKPAAGEQASRAALRVLDEVHAKASDRAQVVHSLGLALLAQRRFADARTALTQALDLAHAGNQRADVGAEIEGDLARAEDGLGHHITAHAHAVRAHAVLGHFPGQVLARKRLEPLLK